MSFAPYPGSVNKKSLLVGGFCSLQVYQTGRSSGGVPAAARLAAIAVAASLAVAETQPDDRPV